MKSSMKTFLSELYEIDPDLRKHESELIPLLEKLLKSDPAQSPDQAFVSRLRMQLRDRASLSSSLSQPSTMWNKLLYALGGAVAVAVLVPVVMIGMNKTSFETPHTPLFGYNVENTGAKAFGSLDAITSDSQTTAESGAPRTGGGGGGPPTASMGYATNDVIAVPTPDAKMIAPMPPLTHYSYQFEGKLPELSDNVFVYKKRAQGQTVPFSSFGTNFNVGTLNLGSFPGMTMDSLSLSQQSKFGYTITINSYDSSVSINAQWNQWPGGDCNTEKCFQEYRTKIGDMLEDAELIDIAKAFAEEHGIDLSHYGAPVADHGWKSGYEAAADKAGYYLPNYQMVTFPFIIDGKETRNQTGGENGIFFDVDSKQKRVSSVNGITDHSYLKSEYDGVTDAAAIQKYLSTVNNYPVLYMEANQPTPLEKTVKLGTPTIGLAVHYVYEKEASVMLVPSLFFPVIDEPETFWPKTVVVPLAKDVFDEQNSQPRPMPLDNVKAM